MNNSLLKGDLILYRTTKFWTKPNRKHLKDKKKYIAQMMISVLDMKENIVGKGENAGYHNVFKRLLHWGR